MSLCKQIAIGWSCALVVVSMAPWMTTAHAQPPGADAPQAADSQPPASDELADRQARIADHYARLEQKMLKIAEFEEASSPRRAALLRRAFQQSQDNLTKVQLDKIVGWLGQQQLKRAIDGQGVAIDDLRELLKLLQSENRSDRLKSQQQRIKEYIKEVERLRRLQAAARGRTEGGGDQRDLAREQERIAGRTGDLGRQVEQDEAFGGGDGDAEGNGEGDSKGDSEGDSEGDSSGDSKGDSEGDSEGDSKGDSQGDSEGDSEGDSKGDSEGDSEGDSNGDSKGDNEGDSEGDSKGDSQGDSEGDSQGDSKGDSQGDSNAGDQSSDENSIRKRLREAEEKMRQAQQDLEQAKRDEAIEDQRLAEQKLDELKRELEEILRQLREEEVERMLAMLEGRFVRMLAMQLKVYENTKRIDLIPADQRGREMEVRARQLSFSERKITVEADRALALLLEEGSSIAFPEAVEQMREDMAQVAERLAAVKVGIITQGIEEDIITALEEIIEALQKAQQEPQEQPPMPPMPPQPTEPQDQPLVDEIAELKMIRALQFRVNTRTKRYARLLDDADDRVGQATEDDLHDALSKLGERENRIHRVTRDIVLGKNK